MPARRVAAAVLLALAACRAPAVPRGSVTASRELRPGGLCEDVYTLLRPPLGPFDRVNAHRLARCDAAGGREPVILYLPGMHMNGALPADESAPDLRRELAAADVRVWSVDYRTHAVPVDASAEALETLAPWTADLFADDVEALATIARTIDHGPLYVAGFSFGAGLAYRLAARGDAIDGLVILDGVPPAEASAPAGDGPAIDVGSARLPWAEREHLLAAVLADPAGASPVAGYATAGEALADIAYTARTFGGRGGLSAAKDGVTDVRALARLLASYDRWWPRAAMASATVAPPPRALAVLAFASANMGEAWATRVRDGARAYGGAAAEVHDLAGFGHVDVLIANRAPALVWAPVRAFVTGGR